jgi:hypothetical protein
MDLRICPAQSSNIRLVACFVEPSEHRIELPTQDQPNNGQGKSLEFHALAEDETRSAGKWIRGEPEVIENASLVSCLPTIQEVF